MSEGVNLVNLLNSPPIFVKDELTVSLIPIFCWVDQWIPFLATVEMHVESLGWTVNYIPGFLRIPFGELNHVKSIWVIHVIHGYYTYYTTIS